MKNPIILLFRFDLRLSDNPALFNAALLNKPIIPVFIFDETDKDARKLGRASKWWLFYSLKSLSTQLKSYNSRLLLYYGNTEDLLNKLIKS